MSQKNEVVVDAKGDILVGKENNLTARLGVGEDGAVLTADSSAQLGVAWSNGTSSTAGVVGDIPAASADNVGDLYFATDEDGGTLYRSNGASWVQVSAPVSNPLLLSGTGSPVGVVSAAAGSRYVDTDQTNGARVWFKASGTGSTSWIVDIGDTGWRNVTPESGFTATTLRIRRINQTVHVDIDINGSAKTANVFYTLPAGLVGTTPIVHFPLKTGTTATIWGFGGIANLSVNSTSTTLQGSVAFPAAQTGSPWPTALPGTAA